MARTRVQIDLNDELADGTTMALLNDVFGEVRPGRIVTVFEPDDEVEGVGFVERVNIDSGYVYVRVNWKSIHDVAPEPSMLRVKILSREADGAEPLPTRPVFETKFRFRALLPAFTDFGLATSSGSRVSVCV